MRTAAIPCVVDDQEDLASTVFPVGRDHGVEGVTHIVLASPDLAHRSVQSDRRRVSP